MSDSQDYTSVFRIDVSPDATASAASGGQDATTAIVALLHQMVAMQKRQNELLEQLVQATVAVQRQRTSELQKWQQANPRLARACQKAAETLSRVQTEFLETLTEEVMQNEEHLMEGDFMLNEFVDRFGPRLAHLNGVLQVLAQLGSGVPAPQ